MGSQMVRKMRELNLENLAILDGGVPSEAFASHMRRMILDCEDRPGDNRARTLKMTIAVVPVMPPGGTCSEVKAQVKFESTIPPHQTQEYSMAIKADGRAAFAQDTPDNAFQGAMAFDEEA